VILGGWQSSSFSSYETPNRREASNVKDALPTQRLHDWELHARLPAPRRVVFSVLSKSGLVQGPSSDAQYPVAQTRSQVEVRR
jgi:hypothetical protein